MFVSAVDMADVGNYFTDLYWGSWVCIGFSFLAVWFLLSTKRENSIKAKKIRDTPTTPVAHMQAGALTELNGTAATPNPPMYSPFYNEKCLSYSLEVTVRSAEQGVANDGSSSHRWQEKVLTISKRSECGEVMLDDGTGQAKIFMTTNDGFHSNPFDLDPPELHFNHADNDNKLAEYTVTRKCRWGRRERDREWSLLGEGMEIATIVDDNALKPFIPHSAGEAITRLQKCFPGNPSGFSELLDDPIHRYHLEFMGSNELFWFEIKERILKPGAQMYLLGQARTLETGGFGIDVTGDDHIFKIGSEEETLQSHMGLGCLTVMALLIIALAAVCVYFIEQWAK